MLNEERLIEQLKQKSESAFVELYKVYSPLLFGICMRYAKQQTEAEDILQESFIKIFESIGEFRNAGSFEGWLKRIVVNVSINYYRKKVKNIIESTDKDFIIEKPVNENIFSELTNKELVGLLQHLPEGYRIVFNMFVIEGYKHPEIGEILNISPNTSKTQLMKAKKKLQELVFKLYPRIAKTYIESGKDKTLVFDF